MRPKRERESGVFGAIAQSSWFRGAAVDDESGEKQLRAICVIIAVEFGLPLSTVRGYVDSDKSIDDIACAHLFFTEQSEAHLSDREKGKERARRQKKNAKKGGGVAGLSDREKRSVNDSGSKQKDRSEGWRTQQVTLLCAKLGKEFSYIHDAIEEGQTQLDAHIKKATKVAKNKNTTDKQSERYMTDRARVEATMLKNGDQGRIAIKKLQQKKDSEQLHAGSYDLTTKAGRKQYKSDKKMKQICETVMVISGVGVHLSSAKLRDLANMLGHAGDGREDGREEHVGEQTDLYIRELLEEFSDASLIQVHRYGAEYYGLEAAETDAIMLEACTEYDHESSDIDSYFDNAVMEHGRRQNIRFTQAAVEGAQMNASPATEYGVLNVVKTICAAHFPSLSFASIAGGQEVRTLHNADQHGVDEREVAASLVQQMVLLSCDRKHITGLGDSQFSAESDRCRRAIESLDGTTVCNLLLIVLQVPLKSRHHMISNRGAGRFTLLAEDSLISAVLTSLGATSNESFVSFAIRKKNARLLEALFQFGGGTSLVLADLHASMEDIRDTIFDTVLRAYSRPVEAIHAIMNNFVSKLDGFSAMEHAQSERVSWVAFGCFEETCDVLLQSEFFDVASKCVINDRQYPPTPLSFCSRSTMQLLIDKFSASRRNRPILPSEASSLLLVVEKANGGSSATQLFSGDTISARLQTFVKQHQTGTERTPHMLELLEAGKFDLVHDYLAEHLDPGCRAINGKTLAHFAAASSCPDFRELFHHTETFACDSNGWNVLHVAAKCGRLQHIEAILDGYSTSKRIADMRTPHSLSALHIAAKFGHTSCVKLLLQRLVDVPVDSLITNGGRTALQLAVLSSDPDKNRQRDWAGVVRALMRAGANALDLNPKGENALSLALMCTGVSGTQLADHLDDMIANAPHEARALSIHGLVHDCTDVSINSENDLTMSTSEILLQSQPYRRLSELLKLGADVNASLPPHVDSTMRTPIHCARSAVVATLLQDYDADVHRKCGPREETPLNVVCAAAISEQQKCEVCRVLLDAFCEYKHALDSNLKSPPDVASERGLMLLVKLFDAEEARRRENYEQLQLDLQRRSELNLSKVDVLLAKGDVAKNLDVAERVDMLVKNIKSQVDHGDSAGRPPKPAAHSHHHLSPSGALRFDDARYEVFLTGRAAERIFAVDQETAHLILATLFELATTNNTTKVVSDETPKKFKIFTAHVVGAVWFVGDRASVYSTRFFKFLPCFRIWDICLDDSLLPASRENLVSSLENGSTSKLCECGHIPLADSGTTGQSIVKLHLLTTFFTTSVLAPNASSISAREHPCHPARKEAEIMRKLKTQRSSCESLILSLNFIITKVAIDDDPCLLFLRSPAS